MNLITLFGLALAVGLLVDNSVVVYEAVQRRLERGADPETAVFEGLRQAPLTEQTLSRRGTREQLRAQHLDRQFGSPRPAAGTKHPPHATRPDLKQN